MQLVMPWYNVYIDLSVPYQYIELYHIGRLIIDFWYIATPIRVLDGRFYISRQ